MTRAYDRDFVVLALKQAVPYIRLYRGRTFVLKLGGSLCEDAAALRDVIEQVSVLSTLGIRVVLVHGGGPQTTALAARLGLVPTIIDGRRVTCEQTLAAAIMAQGGSVRTAILAACRALELSAIGLSGIDAGLVRAVRRPVQLREVDGTRTAVDFGFVGDVLGVDARVLDRLFEAGMVPIVSSLCADDDGQVLNVNADTVAAALAAALGAEKLIVMTETAGLLEDKRNPASLVSYTDVGGLDDLQARGAIDGGMLPKLEAVREALAAGVRRVHLLGYRGRSTLLIEIFTNEGAGTLIVKDTAELLPDEKDEPARAAQSAP